MTLSELRQTKKVLYRTVSAGDTLTSILFQIYETDVSGFVRMMLAKLNQRLDLDNLYPGSVFYYFPLDDMNALEDII